MLRVQFIHFLYICFPSSHTTLFPFTISVPEKENEFVYKEKEKKEKKKKNQAPILSTSNKVF